MLVKKFQFRGTMNLVSTHVYTCTLCVCVYTCTCIIYMYIIIYTMSCTCNILHSLKSPSMEEVLFSKAMEDCDDRFEERDDFLRTPDLEGFLLR